MKTHTHTAWLSCKLTLHLVTEKKWADQTCSSRKISVFQTGPHLPNTIPHQENSQYGIKHLSNFQLLYTCFIFNIGRVRAIWKGQKME